MTLIVYWKSSKYYFSQTNNTEGRIFKKHKNVAEMKSSYSKDAIFIKAIIQHRRKLGNRIHYSFENCFCCSSMALKKRKAPPFWEARECLNCFAKWEYLK